MADDELTEETAEDGVDVGLDDLDVTTETVSETEIASESAAGALLPRVRELLTRISPDEERQRFERFFSAAAMVIERLGELEVSDNEAAAEDEDPTDAFWEQLAPEISGTLEGLQSFLDVVRTEFPAAEEEDDGDLDLVMGDDDFDLSGGSSDDEAASEPKDSVEETAKVLSAFCMNLGHELRQLEDSMNTAPPPEERWSLLEQLGEFRGRSRSGIGEMVFLLARQFAVVRKEDVVPFYKEDVDSSLALRGAIADLVALVATHRAQLDRLSLKDEPEEVRECLGRFLSTCSEFTSSEAYGSLRVIDKRSFMNVRQELADLVNSDELAKREIDTSIEGLTKFLDSLSLMNRRELLLVHDREAVADTEHQLNGVLKAVSRGDLDEARTALGRAVQTALPLLGRDIVLDGLLKLFEHVDIAALSLSDVLSLANLLRNHL